MNVPKIPPNMAKALVAGGVVALALLAVSRLIGDKKIYIFGKKRKAAPPAAEDNKSPAAAEEDEGEGATTEHPKADEPDKERAT